MSEYQHGNILRLWHKEYLKTGVLHHKLKIQRYSIEQKEAAVAYYL